MPAVTLAAPLPRVSPGPATVLGASGPKVVVEDDPNSLEVIAAFVAESGGEVVCVSLLDEAQAAWATHRDGLRPAITDIKLRARSGLDLFRRIRASFPAPPVIVITAYGNTGEAVAAMRDGGLYYFMKPVNLPLLLRLVREAA